MNRREAVKSVAFLMGGALSATTIGVFLEGCNSTSTKAKGSLFTDHQQKLITEVADYSRYRGITTILRSSEPSFSGDNLITS